MTEYRKLINGEVVDMTPEEIAAHLAESIIPRAMPDLTMRQFRLGLLGAGLLATVETTIEAMQEPTKSAARIEFEYATTVSRHHSLVAGLSAAIGLTDEQIDALWLSASEIV